MAERELLQERSAILTNGSDRGSARNGGPLSEILNMIMDFFLKIREVGVHMKGFIRSDRLFSLCGLNCGLCTMRLGSCCPGCGGGEGNQGCAIARCSLEHGGIAYCFQCGEYPCARCQEAEHDSFITYQNRLRDLEKARRMGMDAYWAGQRERSGILRLLLERYNDGRKKTLFALAANLLELEDLREILERLSEETAQLPLRERAVRAAALCREAAALRGIDLRLRKPLGKSGK